MKFERSDIKFPLWRKKVDTVLLDRQHTPIPNWLSKVWHIGAMIGQKTSKKNSETAVVICFKEKKYNGWITYAKYQQKDPLYKLFISKELSEKLKDSFIMSYMRTLEWQLRKRKGFKGSIEEEIPFWEFLDIEFDKKTKTFYFTAHYFQKPIFPELFKQFIKSHVLNDVENLFSNKGAFKFIKENWKPRSDFKIFPQRRNIIYYLIDTKNKLLYIGEADHTNRIIQSRSEIANWDYFRVDCLPTWLSKPERVELERLIIRSFAALLHNQRAIHSFTISKYKLINRKIDL